MHLYVVEKLGACREEVSKHRPQGGAAALADESMHPGVNATLNGMRVSS